MQQWGVILCENNTQTAIVIAVENECQTNDLTLLEQVSIEESKLEINKVIKHNHSDDE